MNRSAHTDSFARDNLPPQHAWPDIDLSNFDYGAQLNAAVELTDEMVARGRYPLLEKDLRDLSVEIRPFLRA